MNRLPSDPPPPRDESSRFTFPEPGDSTRGSFEPRDRTIVPGASGRPVVRAEFIPDPALIPAPGAPAETPYQGAPIHPLAALGTIALDLVWGVGEAGGTATVVGMVAVPVLMLCTATLAFWLTLTIQRFVARDTWSAAFAKGLLMAIIAGVPYPVAGTAVGSVMLAWAGLSALGRK